MISAISHIEASLRVVRTVTRPYRQQGFERLRSGRSHANRVWARADQETWQRMVNLRISKAYLPRNDKQQQLQVSRCKKIAIHFQNGLRSRISAGGVTFPCSAASLSLLRLANASNGAIIHNMVSACTNDPRARTAPIANQRPTSRACLSVTKNHH